jgi:hypothetical protein
MAEQESISHKPELYLRLLFFFLLAAVAADKLFALMAIGFAYTDADQALIWNAAYDMLHGRFYEPCFYGQSYNPLIESFLAVPLLALHIRPYIALPIVTAILGLLPYLLFSIFSYRRRWYLAAFISISLPLLMPFGFEMLTMMPRGFVTGIFFAVIGSAFILFGNSRYRFLLFSFFSIIALTANPNCGLIVLPVLLYIMIEHYRIPNVYIQLLTGALIALPFPLFIYYFYQQHPELIVHSQKSKGFVPELLVDALQKPGMFLHDILPFSFSLWFLVLLLLLVICLAFFQNEYRKPVAVSIAAFVIFILSLGIEKVHDGRPVIFLPYSRMYLALPFLIVVITVIISRHRKIKASSVKILAGLLLPVVLIGTFIRYNDYKSRLNADISNSKTVPARPVASICDSCELLTGLAKRYDVQTVAFYGYTRQYCYGCAALGYNFHTIYPIEDRRVWIVQRAEQIPAHNILLWPEDTAFTAVAAAKGVPCKKVNARPAIYLLDAEGQPLIALMKQLGLPAELKF